MFDCELHFNFSLNTLWSWLKCMFKGSVLLRTVECFLRLLKIIANQSKLGFSFRSEKRSGLAIRALDL